MKYFLIFITLTSLISSPAAAQFEKDLSIAFGVGTSFTGTGDLRGYRILNQVEYHFVKPLSVVGGVTFLNAWREDYAPGLHVSTTAITPRLSILFYPYQWERIQLKFGGGISANFETSTLSEFQYLGGAPVNEPNLRIYPYPLHQKDIGFNALAQLDIKLNERFYTGAMATFEMFSEGQIYSSAMLHLGMKINKAE